MLGRCWDKSFCESFLTWLVSNCTAGGRRCLLCSKRFGWVRGCYLSVSLVVNDLIGEKLVGITFWGVGVVVVLSSASLCSVKS